MRSSPATTVRVSARSPSVAAAILPARRSGSAAFSKADPPGYRARSSAASTRGRRGLGLVLRRRLGGLLDARRAEDARVAVVDLHREAVQRGRVDAPARGAPRVDRIPRAELVLVRVLALVVDDRGLDRLVPPVPARAADLEHRERAVVPVVEVDVPGLGRP